MNLEDKIDKYLNEVTGYKMKTKDKKIVTAFVNGETTGDGDSLWIEGDFLHAPFRSSAKDALAKRNKDGSITVARADGNVSQTWVNFLKKMIKKSNI